jgi:DNA-binding IclR family transcriptional regulator
MGPKSHQALRQLLVEVRRSGYGQEDGFVTSGLASVAGAVLDHTGYPVASIALTFPIHEVNPAIRKMLATEVQESAKEISRGIYGSA